MKNQHRILQKS